MSLGEQKGVRTAGSGMGSPAELLPQLGAGLVGLLLLLLLRMNCWCGLSTSVRQCWGSW